jgi:hypothetical protein
MIEFGLGKMMRITGGIETANLPGALFYLGKYDLSKRE